MSFLTDNPQHNATALNISSRCHSVIKTYLVTTVAAKWLYLTENFHQQKHCKIHLLCRESIQLRVISIAVTMMFQSMKYNRHKLSAWLCFSCHNYMLLILLWQWRFKAWNTTDINYVWLCFSCHNWQWRRSRLLSSSLLLWNLTTKQLTKKRQTTSIQKT